MKIKENDFEFYSNFDFSQNENEKVDIRDVFSMTSRII